MSGDNSDRAGGPTDAEGAFGQAGQVTYSNDSLHEVFRQQVVQLLENADISEEKKQEFLVALTCPCCGAGGLSLSLDIKSDQKPTF